MTRWDLGFRVWGLGCVAALVFAGASAAQDMPDPSQIHGRAIPAPELPNGTVTVRVVRENIGNNIAGQEVRVTVGNATTTARTDELGRAEFRNISRDTDARAEAVVDGERLESQPFAVPTSGGLRVILIAGMARAAERRKLEEAAAAAAPAMKGTVVFGGDSRVLMQFNDDILQVYYVLEVVNNARSRVDIGGPLIIELPRTAIGATVLEGSSPTARANATRVTVTGPFASGTTSVQVAYTLPFRSAELVFEQAFPAPMQKVTVGVEKVGAVAIASKQLATIHEIRAENGTPFAVGNGGALQAGTPLTVTLSNLPVRSPTPRYVALGLALTIVAIAVWLSVGGRTTRGDMRDALRKRRDALLADLAQLEVKRRAGEVGSDRYLTRRQRMIGELEQIYAELDDAGTGPQGGGEGVAA